MTVAAFTGNADPAVRRSGVGGTDVAKIVGVSRFGGPFDVYAEKKGVTAPLVETEPMTWGKLLEDAVARHWSKQTGVRIWRVNRTLRHPSQFFKFAHVDRMTSRGILEVKTAGQFAAADFGEQDTDEVPADYYMQALHYCHVTGKPRVDFALLIGGQAFRRYVYERNLEVEEAVEGEVERFWQENIVPGIPPAYDASEGASAFLAGRFPRVLVPSVPFTDEMEVEAIAYQAAHETEKSAKESKLLHGNRLRGLLGDGGQSGNEVITVRWSDVAGSRKFQLDEFRAAHPSMAEEFTRQDEPGRRLTVTVREG